MQFNRQADDFSEIYYDINVIILFKAIDWANWVMFEAIPRRVNSLPTAIVLSEIELNEGGEVRSSTILTNDELWPGISQMIQK